MSDQKETPTSPAISLDDIIKHAQEKLYLRSRIDELDGAMVTAIENRLRDQKRHNETLALVVRESTKEPAKPSTLLSKLIEHYKRDRLVGNKWTPKTQGENLAIYKLCIDIIGDRPISEIGKDQALTYIETLQKLPANMNKMPAYRGKTIAEIIALSPPPMATRSINKSLERISSLLQVDNECHPSLRPRCVRHCRCVSFGLSSSRRLWLYQNSCHQWLHSFWQRSKRPCFGVSARAYWSKSY